MGVLTLAAAPFYISCFFSHVWFALDRQHVPYEAGDAINDLFWTAYLVSVTVLSFTLHAKRRELFAFGSIILILSRLVLGSLGGTAILIELPLLIAMSVYALGYIFFAKKFYSVVEQTTAVQFGDAGKTRLSFCLFGLLILGGVAAWQCFQR